MTVTDSTEPARPNNSCNSASPTSYGRFPTYSFRPMTMHSPVAVRRSRSPALASAGCCLVARLNFRGSESRGLVTLEDGEYAAIQAIDSNTSPLLYVAAWYHRFIG